VRGAVRPGTTAIGTTFVVRAAAAATGRAVAATSGFV